MSTVTKRSRQQLSQQIPEDPAVRRAVSNGRERLQSKFVPAEDMSLHTRQSLFCFFFKKARKHKVIFNFRDQKAVEQVSVVTYLHQDHFPLIINIHIVPPLFILFNSWG